MTSPSRVTPERLARAHQACLTQEVLAPVRHDVRNRLGAIRNAAFYLRRKTEKSSLWAEDARFARFFDLIGEEVLAADAMLDRHDAMLNLYEAVEEEVDLRACVEQAAAGLSLSTEVEVRCAPHSVRADQAELVVALREIVVNAEAATTSRGAIRIDGVADDGGYLLSVVDDGPGFAPEVESDPFARFVTTKPGHAGLGLAMALRIARRWGARIELARIGSETHVSLRFGEGP